MLNTQQLEAICQDNKINIEALRLEAEANATPQEHKCWGLTDKQSDAIAWLHSRYTIQAAVNLIINHYRSVNSIA
jgi:hypothetical protein